MSPRQMIAGALAVMLALAINPSCGSKSDLAEQLADEWDDLHLYKQAEVCLLREFVEPDAWAEHVVTSFDWATDKDAEDLAAFLDERCPVGPLDDMDKKAIVWLTQTSEDKRLMCDSFTSDPEFARQWAESNPAFEYLDIDVDLVMEIYADECD